MRDALSTSAIARVLPEDGADLYRILLVADDPDAAGLLGERLSGGDNQFIVTTAVDAAGATRALASGVNDAVVVCLTVPDNRSIETLRQIRSAAGSTPVIVVSETVNRDLRRLILREGADDAIAWAEAGGGLLLRSVRYVRERNHVREQRRQLALLLDAAPDAIIVVNLAGTVRYVNQAAISLFGRSKADLLAEPLGFSVKDGETGEISIQTPTGRRVGEIRVVAIAWESEQAQLAAVRDVTERVHGEQLRARTAELEQRNYQIEQASRLKSQFVANMSHELRTPLNAIIGFASMMHGGHTGPLNADQTDFLGDILRSGRHLLGLIKDVLDMAKVEAGKIDFSPQSIALSREIREVVEVLRPVAAQKRIEIRVDAAPAVDEVVLDPVRLHQVLYNYISNALKFSPDESKVTIRTAVAVPGMVRIEVEDAGIGIAPDDIGKLFGDFQQLDAGVAKRYQGAGLGLALTKRLVEAQGGSVGVLSTPGSGSTFFAILPRGL